MVDQALSSVSNFAATLVGARVLSVDEFGGFSLGLLTYTLCLGFNRGLACEALLVRPGESVDERARRVASATASSFWLGLIATLACVAGAVLTSGDTAWCLAVTGVAMPALLIQDTQRYASFARGEPLSALRSDATWVGAGAVAFTMLMVWRDPSAPLLLAAWALAGAAGAAMQMIHDGVRPRFAHGVRWTIEQRDLSLRYALDFISGQGAGMVATYALAGIAGVAAVGSIRGAQTLFGPLNILLTGTYVILVPEGRRALARSRRRFTTMFVGASGAFMLAGTALLGVFLLLGPSTGTQLLGPTWENARTVILPIGLAAVAGGTLSGATAGLRAMVAAKELLRVRVLTMPTTLLLPIAGALLDGAVGLAYGIAISVCWNAFWYWRVFFTTLEARLASGVVPAEGLDSSAPAVGDLEPGPARGATPPGRVTPSGVLSKQNETVRGPLKQRM